MVSDLRPCRIIPDADPGSRSGFTLIEILVAIVLFVVVSTALYGSYSTIVRTTHGLYDHLDRLEGVRACIVRIRADLAAILVTSTDAFLPPDQRPDPDPYRILAESDPVTGNVRFEFASMAQLPFSENTRPAPVRIIYTARKDGDGRWVLYRDQRLLGSEPSPDRPIPKLATGLVDLTWAFDAADGRSRDHWDSDSEAVGYATPRVIRLRLAAGPNNGETGNSADAYTFVYALPVFRKAMP